MPDEARVRYQIETGTGYDLPHDVYLEKAGPREGLFFETRETKAAVVTCGGVCPVLTMLFALQCSSFTITMACRKCWAFATGTRVSTPNLPTIKNPEYAREAPSRCSVTANSLVKPSVARSSGLRALVVAKA